MLIYLNHSEGQIGLFTGPILVPGPYVLLAETNFKSACDTGGQKKAKGKTNTDTSSCYWLARMTMSIPQKMLMIHPTMITAVRIWIRAAATLSQNTQQTPRSEISSLRAPHSTVNAEMKVPVGKTPQVILLPKTIQEVIVLTVLMYFAIKYLCDVYSPTW